MRDFREMNRRRFADQEARVRGWTVFSERMDDGRTSWFAINDATGENRTVNLSGWVMCVPLKTLDMLAEMGWPQRKLGDPPLQPNDIPEIYEAWKAARALAATSQKIDEHMNSGRFARLHMGGNLA
ncbi:hypothetical protein [Sagittula salina]|uniref:Uncharacterized protein n=1 Tax=Sagittula salina TaxID=2820268 RepID=A0A940MTB1_9RHOB|nr:hypothetical protein [Sagittula salina]MBP0484657.1 hypothetical protein [Sagittula salina]